MTRPGGMAGASTWRIRNQDSAVINKKLAPGTLRRVASFAEPYRKELAIFLLLTIISSLIGVITPLLAGDVINEISSNGTVRVVVQLAAVIAGLAVLDALLSLGTRWFSSRIGEGLIFDMRTKVFQHVQQMSLAFFTRTQTGALVSRLNNDVIGAQQAFTSTLSGVVANVIGLVLTSVVMFTLSWQVTVLSLILLPIFVLPAKRFGRKLQALTRESYGLNASMNTTTTERFNVSGALLVTLFGRPEVEAASFSDRAGRVRDIGITHGDVRPGLHRRARAGGGAGPGADLRARRDARAERLARAGRGGLAGPAADPALRAADGAVQRPGRRDERVGLLRAGLRGARPQAADHREARRATARSGSAIGGVRRRALRLPRRRRGVAGLPGGRRGPRSQPAAPGAARRQLPRRGRSAGGAGRAVRRRQDHHLATGSAGLRRQLGQRAGSAGSTSGTSTLQSLHDAIGVVAQDAHLFHDTIRANLLYAKPDAPTSRT